MNRWIWLAALTLLLPGCDRLAGPASTTEVANQGLLSASLSRDGAFLLAGSVFEGGSLWRTSDRERLYNWNHKTGEQSTLQSSAFDPEGLWAATATSHTIVLWSLASGQAARFWNAPDEVLDLALTPQANYALLGLADGTAVLFNIKQGKIFRTLRHQSRVRKVDLTRDGRLAITGSEDQTAVVWDLNTGEPLHRFQHGEEVQMVALSDDGRYALTAAKYDSAIVWELSSGRRLGQIPLAGSMVKRGLRFTAARFSPDGNQLLTGRPDEIVQLWDVQGLKELKRWRLPKRDSWQPTGAAVLAVAFDESGDYWAAAGNGFVHRLK